MAVAFVYPFWQKPARYDELRWSIRSIYRHFQGDEFNVIIAGDQPILKRSKTTWFDGQVINIPRKVTGRGRVSIHDAAGKFLAALEHPDTPQRVVWMMDDTFFLKDVTWQDLTVPRAGRQFNHRFLQKMTTRSWWRRAKKDTANALIEAGHTAWDFATHLPHAIDRDTAVDLFRRFEIVGRTLLWEVIYGNVCLQNRQVQRVRPFLKVVSRKRSITDLHRITEDSYVLNLSGNGWSENLRQFLFDRFPDKSPLERGSPAPTKIRPAK